MTCRRHIPLAICAVAAVMLSSETRSHWPMMEVLRLMGPPSKDVDLCHLIAAIGMAHTPHDTSLRKWNSIGHPEGDPYQLDSYFTPQPHLKGGFQEFLEGNGKSAYRLLLPFADTGDAEAQYIVGCILTRSWLEEYERRPLENPPRFRMGSEPLNRRDYTDDDINSGIDRLIEASRQGHTPALLYLGHLGWFSWKNYPKSNVHFKIVRGAATNGHEKSYGYLAAVYDNRGDHAQAFKWRYLYWNCTETAVRHGRQAWSGILGRLSQRSYGPEAIREGNRLIALWKERRGNKPCK